MQMDDVFGSWRFVPKRAVRPFGVVVVPVNLLPVPVVVSGRINYVGLFLDSYTETNVDFPLAVDRHMVSMVNTRAQITFPKLSVHGDGSHTHVDFRLGGQGLFDVGSTDISGSVGAGTFSHDARHPDEVLGFAGLSIKHGSADGRRSLSLNAELSRGLDPGYHVTGEIRAVWRF